MDFNLRTASPGDAKAIVDIYRPFVVNSAVSFENEPPGEAQMAERIASTLQDFPWLVAEKDGEILGYAYATKYRARAAYQWSVEATIYVKESAQRQGIARVLYEQLFETLKRQGIFVAYAVITMPNEKSVKFHEALGFKYLCTYPQAGFKNERWQDVGWWRLELAPLRTPPVDPIPFSQL